MKKIYNPVNVSVIIFLMMQSLSVSAAREEFSKSVHKEYPVQEGTWLQVINKYGTVNIQDWDKPQIDIDVKITVDMNDKAEADKLLQMIQIDFSETGGLVKAVTNIDDRFGTSGIWSGFKGGKKFSIDYTVHLPSNLHVNLTNKYGNIVINKLSGLLEINLKYGHLNINQLTRGDTKPLNTIVLGYGKANIEQCGWLKFDLSYSQANFTTCKALILVSKYSKVSLDNASSIVAESAYDGYSFGDLINFVVTGKYSNYSMKSLSGKLDADTKYSDINVESIPKNFKSIKVDNSYGKINLGIAPDASYQLDANVRYAGIKYPENGRVNRIVENTSTSVTGSIGGETSGATVEIRSSYGGVNLLR